ncbi:hypothetical protein EVAR_78699_1 [Eumeta japonica]|uniref:Uncharacterized protein n=1 Tax=Eumeta variegata TaxID=151549 RepID=A0A4C1T0Z4_EUMVA|nr:hypothetical protein EVAR_78699_1 [Eumeta japonica]
MSMGGVDHLLSGGSFDPRLYYKKNTLMIFDVSIFPKMMGQPSCAGSKAHTPHTPRPADVTRDGSMLFKAGKRAFKKLQQFSVRPTTATRRIETRHLMRYPSRMPHENPRYK